jgi:broad specificity phosphatase PhoE
MNLLEKTTSFKNTYYVMRHGEGEDSQYGIIVSDPSSGTERYGLSEHGEEEVQKSIDEALLEGTFDFAKPVVIFSSPFLRARETAEMVMKSVDSSEVVVTNALRERYYGKLEKASVGNYQTAWENDRRSIQQTQHNVENVVTVLHRMTWLVDSLERGTAPGETKNVLLVSHGDPLDILQTAFERKSPMHHRRAIFPLQTGEIRKLELVNH